MAIIAPYLGGDRGMSSRFEYLRDICQIDWVHGPNFKDNGRPVLLQESISVLGETAHYNAATLENTPVFSYVKNANKLYQHFDYYPLPYDFETISQLKDSSPLSRPNKAFYLFAHKGTMQPAKGYLFQQIPWVNSYNYRFDMIGSDYIALERTGPTMMDKLETMNRFKYGLAIENLMMAGNVTEKLWDCFAAGVVPIYFGTPLPRFIEDCIIRLYKPEKAEVENLIENTEDGEYLLKLERIYNLWESRLELLDPVYGFSGLLKKLHA